MTPVAGNDWSVLVPPADATWTPTSRVSICIPAHNPTNLTRVLDALALQTYPTDLIEVSIADDGSEPPVVAPDGYPFPIVVTRMERTLQFGAGKGRNGAARAASGDLLVFLDADIVPERQVVASYARWFVDRPDVMVMGLCRFADMEELSDDEFRALVSAGGLEVHFAGKEVDDQEWRENTFRRTDDLRIEANDAFRIVIGATFAVSAEQYRAVGGFRELGIRGIEDTEFGHRVHANGAVLVLDRDAVHWHQGRRNMNLDRKEQIRVEREPYVERLIPVRGFRRTPPDPLDAPVYTVPRMIIHVAGDEARVQSVRELAEADHLVLGADEPAVAPDGMPFVAAFGRLWLPDDVTVTERTFTQIVRELERHTTGVVQIHGPGGRRVVAMRTRVLRRACAEAGVDPDRWPTDQLVDAAVASFGTWHTATSAAEIGWAGVEVDEPAHDDAGQALHARLTVELQQRRRTVKKQIRRLSGSMQARRTSVEHRIEALLRRMTR